MSAIRSAPVAWLLLMLVAVAAAPAREEGAPDPGAERVAWLAEHAAAVRSIAPEDEDFSDLEPLAAAIGSARVVQLGEATHCRVPLLSRHSGGEEMPGS